MMQLLCNGVFLDMEDNARMTFQKSNPLFAFDDLKCERTTEFSLPATPKNNRVFSLAKDPAYYGEGMRRRFDAQLVNGVCVKNGFIYVSKYENGAYKVIFVTGELFGLQRIKDAGDVAKIGHYPANIEWSASNVIDANTDAARSSLFAMVRYKGTFGEVSMPSTHAKLLALKCAQHLGVAINGWPTTMDNVRLVPPSIEGFSDVSVVIRSEQGVVELGYGDVAINTSTSSFPTMVEPTPIEYNPAEYIMIVEYPYPDSWYWWQIGQNFQGTTIAGWKANVALDVLLPDDLPDSYVMVKTFYPSYSRQPYHLWNVVDVFGDYYGTPVEGERIPLRGRSVRVEKGESFSFINMADYALDNPSDYPEGTIREAAQFVNEGQNYMVGGQPTYEFKLMVSQADEIVVGSDVYQVGNLPEITLIDLLKSIAAMSGMALNYTDDSGISFDPIDLNSWPMIEVKDVTKIGTLERRFCNYERVNVVKFKSGKTVFGGEKMTMRYIVDNDNLKNDNDIMEIPFSEASISTDDDGRYIAFIRNNDDGETDEWCMMNVNADDGSPMMSRVSLYRNAGIDRLCKESTQIIISTPMSQYEYERIGAKTRILFRGILYVWTSAKWVNDTAEFTLAKI